MKKIFTILFCFIVLGINYAICSERTITGDGETTTYYLPTALDSTNTIAVYARAYYSVTQQIYLASELGSGAAKEISALTFFYNGPETLTRRLKVWINMTTADCFSTSSNTPNFVAPGTKVFDRNVTMTAGVNYDINLDSNYEWDGTKNIVITVFDSTGTVVTRRNRHIIFPTSKARFLHNTQTTSATFNPITWNLQDLTSYTARSRTEAQRKYVNKIKITFADAASIATPTNVTASTISYNSAVLSWDAVEGADGYEVRYGTTSGALGDAIDVGDNTSYTISNLEPSTRYYYQVRTVVGEDHSAWTTEAYFNTAAHSHDEITFSKWNFSGTLPSSTGNYYLAQNVTLSSNWEPAGTINICLNGNTINFGSNYGDIDDDATIALFDDNAVGNITSSNASQTLLVDNATLAIHGATIVNTGGGRAIRVINNGSASTDDIIALSDATDNSSTLAEYDGITVNVNLARSWVADGYYSTLCLPFALSSAQVTSIFGTGTELAKLTDSSISGEEITITFTSASSIEAGKPYIILPTQNAVNPSISNVTLSSSTTDATTTYVDFIGTLSPTYLAASEDILFLGANNAIGWPAAAGYLKGMRAYFQLHSLPAGAPALRHARLIAPGHSTPTALDEANENKNIQKRLENGQLIIIRDGKKYNVIGGQQ